MEPEIRKKPIRFYEIDVLRFLAALSVVFYHYTYWAPVAGKYTTISYPGLKNFTKYGYIEVNLFFIISGYVVLLSAQGKTVRQFFLSRVTRLYPAFWVACTITFLVERLWPAGPVTPFYLSPSLWQYGWNMTMLHGFTGILPIDGVYWSLTIEIAFYFLISVLIGYKLLHHLNSFLLMWLVYSILSNFIVGPDHAPLTNTAFSYLFFPQYAPYFTAGMLFYLFQAPKNRTWLRYSLLGVSYVLAIWMSIRQAAELSKAYNDYFSPVVVVGLVTAFFLFFFLIAFRKINLSQCQWLRWLGALTYPLYLLHENIGFLIFKHAEHAANKHLLLLAVVLLMLIGAYAINELIEKRLSKPLGNQVNKLLTLLNNRC